MAKVLDIQYRQPIPGNSSENPNIVVGDVEISGVPTMMISDMSTHELLCEMVLELRKINLRQEEAFEQEINDGDLL